MLGSFSIRLRLVARFLRGGRRTLSEDCDPDEWRAENSLERDVPALLADDLA